MLRLLLCVDNLGAKVEFFFLSGYILDIKSLDSIFARKRRSCVGDFPTLGRFFLTFCILAFLITGILDCTEPEGYEK
jgi:hypothetical protein